MSRARHDNSVICEKVVDEYIKLWIPNSQLDGHIKLTRDQGIELYYLLQEALGDAFVLMAQGVEDGS